MPSGRLAAGTKRSISSATGSMHGVGMVALPLTSVGKISPQFAPAMGICPPSAAIAEVQPGLPFSASAANWSVIEPPRALPVPTEKTPDLSCGFGTVTVSPEMPCLTRRPSNETKKKVRSFMIGPPKVPPNYHDSVVTGGQTVEAVIPAGIADRGRHDGAGAGLEGYGHSRQPDVAGQAAVGVAV